MERRRWQECQNTARNAPTKRITVLLAEDHTLVREGIHMILNLETDLNVFGEA
jgi:hypothetical protein